MRNRFNEQMERLNRELLEMGALIGQSIGRATQALLGQDVAAAREAIEADGVIDRKERDIESLCIKLLLSQQPVASDLRLISAAMRMIADMERIGDQAADISELVLYLSCEPYAKRLEHLCSMADAAVEMVSGSIEAYVNRDVARARRVIEMDDTIDGLFDTIKEELIALIRADAIPGTQAIDLLMIAKYFERIGDHAENIADWVEYAVTGMYKGAYLT